MIRSLSIPPLNPEEQASIAYDLCDFFSIGNEKKYRKDLDPLFEENPHRFTPFSLDDFLRWSLKKGIDLHPKMQRVSELVIKLEQKGFLTRFGQTEGFPPYSLCYGFVYALSVIEMKGNLWLGAALGAEFIGHSIKRVLALVVGKTKNGDATAGTGTLVYPGIVLTCAHVIENINLDFVEIENKRYRIETVAFDTKKDVGVIFLYEKVIPSLPDLAFRRSRILEEIVIAGYPSIPQSINSTVTFNRGEISGRTETYASLLEIFSSIARPGNSGGPLVTLDGKIVGIVTRSLERQEEENDKIEILPFFASVPADILKITFHELTVGLELPWEDYNGLDPQWLFAGTS